MKKLITVLVILILAHFSVLMVCAADFDFFFHLSFDDGNGETAEDVSGNGNDGVLNGPEWTEDGRYGGALEFSGGNQYVEVEADVPEENFTMALWIKTDNPGVGVYSVLDAAAGGGGHDRHFYIQGGKICFRVWQGGAWCTNVGVADGKWHHIALVVEGGNGQIAYVDGEEAGNNAYDHSDFDWQKRVWIGFSNDGANDYFVGLIDEPMYINEPLSENDINIIMRPGIAVEKNGKLTTTWGKIREIY